MPSVNCAITFEAKNNLVSGVTAGDEIILSVVLTAFDLSTRVNKVINTTKSGARSSSKFYSEDTYAMTILDDGLVTFENLSTTPLTTEYLEMFFGSVDNSEPFIVTNLDQSNIDIDVQLDGDPARARRSSADVDKFTHTFSVRKVIQ